MLASASQDYSPSYISYADILRKIGPEDAKILQFLALDTNPHFSQNFYQFNHEKNFPVKLSKIIKEKLREEKLTVQELADLIEGLGLQFNLILLYISLPNTLVLPTKYFKENEKSCSVLEREGLIRVNVADIQLRKSLTIQIAWFELTKFGFDFIWACDGHVKGKEPDYVGVSDVAATSKPASS